MKQTVISFGLLSFSVLALFQLVNFSRFQPVWSYEIWIAIFSLIFLLIGIFLSQKLQKEKVVEKHIIIEQEKIVEKEVVIEHEKIIEKEVFIYKNSFTVDNKKLDKLNITKREYEVLQLVCSGMSNCQIGETLFVSENTIKKHVASLFLKLDVARRTEAVRKAREMRLVDVS